jgi:Domain of unknown function (DUF4347)
MRVAIYDKKPGSGFNQAFLCLTWKIGCFLHKLFGKLDAYYGAESWEDAFKWLETRPGLLTSIQYWGHGSPGCVWLAQINVDRSQFKRLVTKVTPNTVLWFRTCSTFQGQKGFDISEYLTKLLGCTVAAHTRTIGILQSGLHTRKPNQPPSWPVTEGDDGPKWAVSVGLQFGNNTIFCLRASIPKGW